MNGNENIRKGEQSPSVGRVLPYAETEGQTAVDLYAETGRECFPWQVQMLYDILATEPDGLWTHTKWGYSVPRRNGKSEVLIVRELYGLLKRKERILHTAHRTTTSHASWERLCECLSNTGLVEGVDYKTIKQFGLERIEVKDGGRIAFRTRSSKGGLGEGYDLLIIDEAQEYTADQESALKYIVTDSGNPQTILTGTPPTPVSSGTVFTSLRKEILSGEKENSGWAEWSIPEQSDIKDRELWYKTNPSLGYKLSERAIADELNDDVVDFNIQRLGLWIKYNQKSAVSRAEWDALEVEKLPALGNDRYIGIKFGHDGINVSMAIAAKTKDGKIFVEAIDCRPVRSGFDWMLPYLANPKVKAVTIDGANGQMILADIMKKERLKKPMLPRVADIVAANALFEKSLYATSICHSRQPSLARVVSNCEHRAIGKNGGFGYSSILAGADISLLDAVVLAHWQAATAKEVKIQKIYY